MIYFFNKTHLSVYNQTNLENSEMYKNKEYS